MMSLDAYLVFDGNCREALEFYSAAFNVKPGPIMTYGQSPEDVSAEDKDRILHTFLPAFGQNLMLCDCSAGQNHVKGNNIMLTIGLTDEAEIKRIFGALSEGGQVYMPLEKTFFAELFGMVCDKFGIIWQVDKIQR
jgi:PhnB protein